MLILTDVQKVRLAIRPVSAAGNPAEIDDTPLWIVSDSTVGTLTIDEDGLGAEFVTSGALGVCQVSVTADADLGDGMREISGVLDIEVRASEAVSMEVSAGVPESRV